MIVSDLTMMIQSRLRDTRNNNWSEEELFDLVNLSYAEVSRDLQIYKTTREYTMRAGDDLYPLPKNLNDIISVSIDGAPADIKSYDWVVANFHKLPVPGRNIVYVNYDGLRVSPKIEEGGQEKKLILSYNFTKHLLDADEELEIPDIAISSLLFYSLYLANQKETDKDSLKRSEYYRGMYEDSINKVKDTTSDAKFSKNITTKYTKV